VLSLIPALAATRFCAQELRCMTQELRSDGLQNITEERLEGSAYSTDGLRGVERSPLRDACYLSYDMWAASFLVLEARG